MNQAISSATLEDDLLLPSWGNWIRNIGLSTGRSSLPGWVVIMLQKQAYRETQAKKYYPEISEEYALKLDRLICKLDQRIRKIIVCIYVYDMSIRLIAKETDRSATSVTQDRDFALAFLYGALKGSEDDAA